MKWSPDLAYAIGLITADGNLSKDGRHLSLVSKDKDQIQTFAKILNLKNKITKKSSSYVSEKKYYYNQDVPCLKRKKIKIEKSLAIINKE